MTIVTTKPVAELLKLWDDLGNIPVDEEQCIEEVFLHFDTGEECHEIWHWFEEQNSFFVCGKVMSGERQYCIDNEAKHLAQ